MTSKRTILLAIVVVGLLGVFGVSSTRGEDFKNPKVRRPKAKPHRRTGGESLPPLPLPATPLRRSEKKRQPAPPALVGMIELTGPKFRIVNARRVRAAGFPTTQVDIERLMGYANKKLNIRYRYMTTNLGAFSWDPTELPILYITGWTTMPELSDKLVAKLRRYLYDGGTLVLHAQCGRKEFYESAKRNIAKIFPKRPLKNLDTDSPLFSSCFKIDSVRVRRNGDEIRTIPPIIKAVYLGTRPAIILSEVDLNCTWDVVNNPIDGGTLYHRDDGLKLGTNLITMVLANFEYARAWKTKVIYPEQNKLARDGLVVAQISHPGDWDPTPHAMGNLMKYIQNNTTLNVQFKRQVVDLSAADVFNHPVLYMTGLSDFKFSERDIKQLRTYLGGGGVLVADAAAGNKAFDVAFRREIFRVLPKLKLEVLSSDSPLYQMPYTIKTVRYTDLVNAERGKLSAPLIEGIKIDGHLGVIYSPLGLAAGWEQLGFAYNRGYSDIDALRLGVNIFAYALTH